jgi:hypothetical protein
MNDMVFSACLFCDDFTPIKPSLKSSLHANCNYIKHNQGTCLAEKILLGKIAPTRSGTCQNYGINGVKTEINRIARAYFNNGRIYIILGNNSEICIGKRPQLPRYFEGKLLKEIDI